MSRPENHATWCDRSECEDTRIALGDELGECMYDQGYLAGVEQDIADREAER